jgi:hypothetical protein
VLLGVAVRDDVRLETRDPVEPVDQPDSLEAFDVIQRSGKGIIDENLALGPLGIAGLNGCSRRLGEGATDDPNGAQVEWGWHGVVVATHRRCPEF